MRHLLTGLYLVLSLVSNGQEVELIGKYGASFIGGEAIEFVGKDSFYFGGFYCTYGVHGKGRCEIRNDNLYLYFEKSKKKLKNAPLKSPIITRTDKSDSISVIEVFCVDNNNIPIPYATVMLESGGKMRIQTTADTSGRATFKIASHNMPVVIKTSAVAIESGEIKIYEQSSYSIKLYHRQHEFSDKELNNGEVYVYEIAELSDNLILVKPQGSSERFRRYLKYDP